MFDNYAKTVQKHPKAIVVLWVVALIVAVPFAINADDSLNYDMTSMGGLDAESSNGQAIVDEYFDGGMTVDSVLVIPYEGDDQLSEIEKGLIDSGALSGAMSDRYGDAGSISVMGSYGSPDSSSGVYLVLLNLEGMNTMNEVGNLRDVVASAMEAAGLDMETFVTGSSAIAYDTMAGANADVQKIDPLSILLIIVLLGLFFWTIVTAAVPPLVVGTAYGLVLALMFALGSVFDIFYITKTLVLVSMLGAGCDYSIFIISRYREERKAGRSKEDSISEAVKWAGESVLTSGLAVVIGFAVMSLCSFSLISSMAVMLAIGIVMAMLAALTLMPAVLSLIGDRVFWPRTIDSYKEGSRERSGVYGKLVDLSKRYFTKAGRFATGHALPVVAVAILLTVPLGYVAVTSENSFDMISVMPDSEGKDGVDAITSATDGGLLMPTYAVMELDQPMATVTSLPGGAGVLVWNDPAYLVDLSRISSDLVGSDDNISYVLGPTSWASVYERAYEALVSSGVPEGMVTPEMVNRAALSVLPDMVSIQLGEFFDMYGWGLSPDSLMPLAPGLQVPVSGLIDYSVNVGAGLVAPDGKHIQMMVVVKDEPMSKASMDTIQSIRDTLASMTSGEDYPWIAGTWVVGTAATLYDISDVVNNEFNMIEVGVILLIYVLLFLVLGSYLTPVRSLATILMSVLWTLGTVQLLFANALAVDVVWIVPIVLFVICLGLGMDYDILLTTRIREGKLKGLSDDDAIVDAVSRSGSIISLCGLIMGGTFLTLLLSGSTMLQEIGFALGFGILIDSLVVVPYVVPAMMHLMGKWSWKGPRFLNRQTVQE